MPRPKPILPRKHPYLQQIARARNWFQGVTRGDRVLYTRIANSDFPGYPDFTTDEDLRLKAEVVVLAIERFSSSLERRWLQLRKQNTLELAP